MQGLTKLSNDVDDVALVTHEEPAPKEGQVVLEVRAAGICGTDLHIVKSEYSVTPPVIIGHEVCGVVAEVGDGVDPGLVGRRVISETFYATCGHCRWCREGRPNLCAQRQSIGTHVNGAMAPRLAVPAAALHAVPDALSEAAASMTEPVACVVNSLYSEDGPRIAPGDRVLVTGPGTIGLLAAQVARHCGAKVTLRGTAGDRARLDLALRLGFETQTIETAIETEAFDAAVECSGSGPAFADALTALRKAGRLMLMGLSGRLSQVPLDHICYKELAVTSGFATRPSAWRRALGLIEDGALSLEPLVTEVVPISDWRHAFDASFAATGVKYVIDPRR